MESGVSENAVSGHVQLVKPGETACFAVRIYNTSQHLYFQLVVQFPTNSHMALNSIILAALKCVDNVFDCQVSNLTPTTKNTSTT